MLPSDPRGQSSLLTNRPSWLPKDLSFAAVDVANSETPRWAKAYSTRLKIMSVARRSEFLAGRLAAELALEALGCPPNRLYIDSSPDRMPVWPLPYVGSISHTDTWAIAIATSAETYASVGVDLVESGSVPPALGNMLAGPREDMAYAAPGLMIDSPAVLFAAKEAIFKAVFPVLRTYFDFTDVSLQFKGNNFSARSANTRLNAALEPLQGYCRLTTWGFLACAWCGPPKTS